MRSRTRPLLIALTVILVAVVAPVRAAEPLPEMLPEMLLATPPVGDTPQLLPTVQPTTAPVPAAGLTPRVYVPVVRSVCLRDAREEQFIALVRDDPNQGRTELICDPILQRIALEHAQDMQNRCYFSHISPEGLGPYERALRAGYLPDTRGYLNIAEIVNGSIDATSSYNAFLRSPSHREILVAQGSLATAHRAATHYGIAFVDNWPADQFYQRGNRVCGFGNTVVVFAAPSGGYPPYQRTAGAP